MLCFQTEWHLVGSCLDGGWMIWYHENGSQYASVSFSSRATWHMRASVSMIHWELFLSSSITVSAVTPDTYTAHNLPTVPEEVSHSQGGNTRPPTQYHTNIQSLVGVTWFRLSITAAAQYPWRLYEQIDTKAGKVGFGGGVDTSK